MPRKPNLLSIEPLFKKGNDFKLTRQEYIKKTGIDIPQDKNYTEKRSTATNIKKPLCGRRLPILLSVGLSESIVSIIAKSTIKRS